MKKKKTYTFFSSILVVLLNEEILFVKCVVTKNKCISSSKSKIIYLFFTKRCVLFQFCYDYYYKLYIYYENFKNIFLRNMINHQLKEIKYFNSRIATFP